MRKSLSVSVLLLVLCCPAFAGDMLTPPVAPPPPPAPYVSTSATTPTAPSLDEAIPAPEDGSATQNISVTQIAVSIFESLLAII